jgi:hypothetical protein
LPVGRPLKRKLFTPRLSACLKIATRTRWVPLLRRTVNSVVAARVSR